MTNLFIDHKIFGNGWGLKSPYFDNKFYWLSGELYGWMGGYGAQLTSFQWFHPKPRERRILNKEEFSPFQSHRRWFRVQISWAMRSLPKDIDKMNKRLREFKKEIDAL